MDQGEIFIEGIRVYAHHGVFPEEKKKGQDFLIDIRLEADLEKASLSDSIDDTVDYAAVARSVAEVATSHSFNLLESLCRAIADRILSDEKVFSVEVTVRKPDAYLGVEASGAGVVLRRSIGRKKRD